MRPALQLTGRCLIALLLPFCLLTVGCDGDSSREPQAPPGTPPDASGGVQVRGTERIAWSQQGDGVTNFQFAALVDNAPTGLSGVQCSPSGASFECSAALPPMSTGRHTFQIVAINGLGAQSPPSAPLTLNVRPGLTTLESPSESTPASSSSLCADCGSLELLVRGLGNVDALASLPDGSFLVLEDRQRVLWVRDGTLTEAVRADPTSDHATQLIDLDVDPLFGDSQFVFALTLRVDPDGGRTASVLRLRATGDQLGEQATVVPEFPINSSASPVLSVGPDRLLYVAVPAADQSTSNRSPYDGALLRFTIDGQAAGSTRTISPVLSEGVARPGPLAWDAAKRLWISDVDDLRDAAFHVLDITALRGLSPAVPLRIPSPVSLSDTRIGGLAFVAGEPTSTAYVVGGTPGLLRAMQASSSGLPSLRALPVVVSTGSVDLTTLAAGVGGELLLAGRESGASAQASAIFRVRVTTER